MSVFVLFWLSVRAGCEAEKILERWRETGLVLPDDDGQLDGQQQQHFCRKGTIGAVFKIC